MAVRHDTFTAEIHNRLDSSGFLVLKGRPTRAGVFIYKDQNGKGIRELRHPDEVFKNDSMRSLSLKPFTLNHPGGLIVTPENSQVSSHGTTGENITRTDDDCLECTISVQSKDAISQIQDKGLIELSAGYRCDILHENGVFNGRIFDQKQVNIVYNHVALVPKGRAGSQCRIRLDSDAAVLSTDNNEEFNMIKKEISAVEIGQGSNQIRLDALTYEENPDNLKIMEQRSTLINALKQSNVRADKAEGVIVSLKTETEELKNAAEDMITSEQHRVDVRDSIELLGMAKEIKLKVEDDYTVRSLKKAICLAKLPDLDQDRADSDDSFLDGVFSGIRNNWKRSLADSRTLAGLFGGKDFQNGGSDSEVNSEGYISPQQS